MDTTFLLPGEEERIKSGGLPQTVLGTDAYLFPHEKANVELRKAVKTPPERAAESRRLVGITQLPPEVVDRNLDEIKSQVRAKEIRDTLVSSPILSRQMRDPQFAKLAHDDIENLSAAEGVVRDIRGPKPSFSTIASGLFGSIGRGTELARQGIRTAFADAIGSEGMRRDAMQKSAAAQTDVMTSTPAFESSTAQGIYGGGESALRMVPGLMASLFTRSTLPMLAAAGVQTTGEAYGKYRGRDTDPALALLGAAGEGGIEVATELLPMSFLVKNFGRVGAGKFLTGMLAREIPSEQLATLGQDAIDTSINNPKTWGQFVAERPDAAYKTLLSTLVQGGLLGGASSLAARMQRETDKADDAEANAQQMAKLTEIAKASKVLARSPADLEQLINDASQQGTVPNIYIDARTFAQAAGEALPQIMAASPSVAAQLDEAMKSGGDLVIPTGEYTTRIAVGDTGAMLLEHIRTDQEGYSQAEAKTYMQAQADEFNKSAEKLMAQHEFDTATKESVATVERELAAQLQSANRFTMDVNNAYAKLASAFYAVQGSRLGITPEEMYVRYPLRITTEGMGGGRVMEQGAIETPEFKRWFGDSKVVDAQGKPMVVYHGGTRWNEADLGIEGRGAFWATEYFPTAVSYADQYSPSDTEIKPLFLRMRKPLDLRDSNVVNAVFPDAGVTPYDILHDREVISNAILYAKQNGYDGVIHPDTTSENRGGGVSYVVFDASQIKAAPARGDEDQWNSRGHSTRRDINRGTFDPNSANILEQPAYHGSPHDFDRFSTDKIGTGEGAQAYGWGLYFAENPKIADGYHRALAKTTRKHNTYKGEKVSRKLIESAIENEPDKFRADEMRRLGPALFSNSDIAHEAISDAILEQNKQAARMRELEQKSLQYRRDGTVVHSTYTAEDYASMAANHERRAAMLQQIAGDFVQVAERKSGAIYQVDIPDEAVARMLDWDKPLSEQADSVKAALEAVEWAPDRSVWAEYTGQQLYEGEVRARTEIERKGKGEAQQAVSTELNGAGIPGIKYFDGMSRTKGDGTRNLVVFDDAIVKLTHKNGKPVTAAERAEYFQGMRTQQSRGQISFGDNIRDTASIITLLKGADLSTFLHELGHFQLEVLADIASQPDAPAAIQKDMADLLKWFGVADLNEWYTLPTEEKRTYHEQFARGFEAYLFEGKSPNPELNGIFARFRAWLVNVYKQLTALNVELNDDVRGVMDRMIATEEQIKDAEQRRGFDPLFTDRPEGVTDEEWADYQNLMIEAPQEAIDSLQSRSLRDMQWLNNARSGALKRLQTEAAARRSEVRVDARREVLSDPVYQAWQFLTRRLTADDKLPPLVPLAPKRSNPDVVDEFRDSLFEAIAKLGGMNKDAVISEWGTDPKDKPTARLVGKPVWRVDGKGLSVDGMAEALGQYGYLPLDENGKPDLHDFEERFGAELRGEPQYSDAYDYRQDFELRNMFNDDGSPMRPGDQIANPDGLNAGRFDKLGLSDIGLPQEIIDHLTNVGMVAKGDGLHPDIVAERFGFSSGDEMTRSLAAAEYPANVIEALTDRYMLERYGDLSSPQALERAANNAIHNEARARFAATEYKFASQSRGPVRVILAAAKDFAERTLGAKMIKELKPWRYEAAEARAGRAAEKARGKDDQVFIAETRNKLLNNALAKRTHEALGEVEKALKLFKRVTTGNAEDTAKTRDVDVVMAARAILADYGIGTKGEAAQHYLEAVQRSDPSMYEVLRDRVDALTRNAKPYSELSLDDFRALRDEIGALWHLASRSRRMEIDGDLLDRKEIQAELRNRLNEIGLPERVPGEGYAVTPGERRLAMLQSFGAAMRRVESWVGLKDGGNQGPFRRFVWQPVRDAADRYRMDKAAYSKRYLALLEAVAPTLGPGRIFAPELGYTFGYSRGGSGMAEVLHAILHTGNASNKRKLLLGRGWATEGADGTLDTSRWDSFVKRMIDEGKIVKAHYDFAQGVWDMFEGTKALAQKTHRDVFGYYFDEVTAEAFVTPFGTYSGGYVPALADAEAVPDAKTRALMEEENASLTFAFPATARGFTKSRVEYNRPLLLDLRVMAQHLDKVLLFSHLESPIRDVRRVLTASEVSYAMNRIDPAAFDGLLTPWLNRTARQQVETPIAGSGGLMRVFSILRARAGMAAMFANLSNTVQQLTGISTAAVKVRPRYLRGAMVDYVRSPSEFARTVAEASPFMETRMANEISQLSGAIDEILLNPTMLESAQAWTQKHAYFLQQSLDNVIGPIVWMGAYNQAIEQGIAAGRDAARVADGVVRETQGSTLPEDISRLETGNSFVRMFTQFAGYFNSQANMLTTEFGLSKSKSRGLYIMLFGFLAPAWMAEFIAQLFKGGPDDDDGDGYLDDWLAAVFGFSTLRYGTAMIPGVGQTINMMANAWNKKPYDDRISTAPSISMLESAGRAPVSVYNAIAEDGKPGKAIKDVATLISLAFGLPATAIARPISYAADVLDNRVEPDNPADMVRGLLTGSVAAGTRQ